MILLHKQIQIRSACQDAHTVAGLPIKRARATRIDGLDPLFVLYFTSKGVSCFVISFSFFILAFASFSFRGDLDRAWILGMCLACFYIALLHTLSKISSTESVQAALKKKENHVLWVLRTILIELIRRNNVMEIAFGNHKNGTRTLDNHTTMSGSQVAQYSSARLAFDDHISITTFDNHASTTVITSKAKGRNQPS